MVQNHGQLRRFELLFSRPEKETDQYRRYLKMAAVLNRTCSGVKP